MKTLISSILAKYGFQLKRKGNELDLSSNKKEDVSPIEAVYKAAGRPVLLNVPLKKCLSFDLHHFPCTPDSSSPFIKCLRDYSSGKCKEYSGSALESFYSNYQPESAAEYMGFDSLENAALFDEPPAGASLLWTCGDPRKTANKRIRIQGGENKRLGLRGGYSEGDKNFGPVSYEKGKLEFDRLIDIYKSIKKLGFRAELGDNIKAVCVYSDICSDYKFKIMRGQHRVAALAFLEYESLVVEIKPQGLGGIVFRSHANKWPLVKNGLLTQAEATEAFDRMFEGVAIV